MSLYQELEQRSLVHASTEGLPERLASDKLTAYAGFDPTASSLHVGSLMPMMALARFQRAGHTPIALIGGGTSLIGDPSGKSTERALLTPEQVQINSVEIRNQLSRFLDFGSGNQSAKLLNNADWLGTLNGMEFFREIGKHFTVNSMLAKESVKRRLESEDGISFTEFSYLLLQAYDFLVLHDKFNCTLQVGGSDQWGNITAGCDLIRRLRSEKVHGLVFPLITTASGEKFGKTEAGTIWLDANLTSPFRFFQFFLNTDDVDVIKYLNFFTFLDQSTISDLAKSAEIKPEHREAQRTLASEVTQLVHGLDQMKRAQRASEVFFGGDLKKIPADDLLMIFDDVPSSSVSAEALNQGIPLSGLLVSSGLTSSKSEATRLIRSGGIYVNERRVTNEKERLTASEAIDGSLFVLRKGAKQKHIVKILSE